MREHALLMALFRAGLPVPEPLLLDTAYRGVPALLHGDYWPENLLWREGRLVGILDWEDAALGDPLSDVAGARLELLWRYGPQAADRFTRAYARQREIDPRRLEREGGGVRLAGIAVWLRYATKLEICSKGHTPCRDTRLAHGI